MDIPKKTDTIVFFLIIIMAFLIGRNLLYNSSIKKIASIKSEIEEEKKKSEIIKTIHLLDNRLQIYQNRSFPTSEITPLLDRVSDLADELGITIETFNPQPKISKVEFIELPVKIPLRCKYHKLGQLLSLIESNPEFIWVKKIQIQKATVVDPKKRTIPKIELSLSGLYLKK